MIDDSGHAPFQRQLNEYFNAWSRAVQQASGPAAAGLDGLGAAAGGPWLQAIHQLARQALEQGLDSAGIAAAWRQILQQGLWPDPMPPGTMSGSTPWAWPSAGAWLEQPVFGPLREHLQRWQQQARQQQQGQGAFADWQVLMTRVRDLALEQFEQLLRSHEQRPLADARALLDLWVEAAEQAWQQVAMGEEFAQLLGQLNQAQMQLLQAQQGEAERVYATLGIASRRELDQAYARIDALERQVRQLLAMQAAPAARPARKNTRSAAGNKTTTKAAGAGSSGGRRTAGAAGTRTKVAAPGTARQAASATTATLKPTKSGAGAVSKRPARRTDKG